MKHWTQFWKASNSLSSFAEGKAAKGYSAEVKEFWEAFTADLPSDAVIVDIGTGNGALAVLFNDLKKEKKLQWKIHGVDAADISPRDIESQDKEMKGRFDGIEFHGQTDITAMPFEDESVDLVVSQFAFEYAEEQQALNEILRILKPSGKVGMLTHHKKSSVHKSTEVGMDVIDYVVGKTPLFMQADLYLRFATQALKHMNMQQFQGTQEAQATGKTTEWVAEHIRAKYKKEDEQIWVNDILRRVFKVLEEAKTAESAQRAGQELAGHYDLLLGHQFRLKDMSNAARTDAQMKKLITAAKKGGAEGSHDAFEVENEVFAWAVTLTKA